VSAAERRLGVRFPAVFRTYLREMAKSRGDLFRGSDLAGVADFEEFRAEAQELLPVPLPDDAIVFLIHQGYQFAFILAAGETDSPVFSYVEGEASPQEMMPSFAALLEAELKTIADANADARSIGGYYRTVHTDVIVSELRPALASGDRPLDRRKRHWWQFWLAR